MDTATRPVVRPVSGPSDYRALAQLIGEHIAWVRSRYAVDEDLIADVLDRQGYADELANLPATYGPPVGQAFLAVAGDEFAGCGAYRRLDDATCEMKRVFVPERFRRLGLGRALCRSVIDAARADGYARMRLDTLDRMREAAALYRSFGFRECAPYQTYAAALMPRIVFMELAL